MIRLALALVAIACAVAWAIVVTLLASEREAEDAAHIADLHERLTAARLELAALRGPDAPRRAGVL